MDEQVEQDLVLSRALAEVFSRPRLRESLAFRGGTALHKLMFDPPGRYSEDLDLVQVDAGPIGPILEELRLALDPWLGEPRWKQTEASWKLLYGFETTVLPARPMRVKVEVNTREHFAVMGLTGVDFTVDNPWHTGSCTITTFVIEELLATKLRALYQRKKGRDLYDLWLALETLDVDGVQVVECMREYLERAGQRVTRAQYEANLSLKLASHDFREDVTPLLREPESYSVDRGAESVLEQLVAKLPGERWKGPGSAI
jgi:predicted nucleotidyltransferase component of viral defense system